MRSRGNIRRQFKLGVRRIIRLAPGTAAWWQQTQTALGEARYQPRRYSDIKPGVYVVVLAVVLK